MANKPFTSDDIIVTDDSDADFAKNHKTQLFSPNIQHHLPAMLDTVQSLMGIDVNTSMPNNTLPKNFTELKAWFVTAINTAQASNKNCVHELNFGIDWTPENILRQRLDLLEIRVILFKGNAGINVILASHPKGKSMRGVFDEKDPNDTARMHMGYSYVSGQRGSLIAEDCFGMANDDIAYANIFVTLTDALEYFWQDKGDESEYEYCVSWGNEFQAIANHHLTQDTILDTFHHLPKGAVLHSFGDKKLSPDEELLVLAQLEGARVSPSGAN